MLSTTLLTLALLLQPATLTPPAPAAPATRPATQPATKVLIESPWRFRKDIERITKLDADKFPAPGSVLFIGSSTFTRWNTAKAFPELPTLNRAFGGSSLPDVIYFADRVAIQYKPKVIVIYCGENDIAGGATVDATIANVERLIQILHTSLPDTKLLYLGLKPSPSRQQHWPNFKLVNDAVAAKSAEWNITFLDFWPLMSPDGLPHEELFVGDRLHNNEAGYEKLKTLLTPAIESALGK